MNKSRRSWLRIAILAFLALFFAVCLVGFAACGDDGGTTDSDPVINPDEGDEDDDTTEGTTGGTTEGSVVTAKFEAEYTDITSSMNAGSMFLGPDTADMFIAILAADDCSNKYCVGNMNFPSTYIAFEIESDAAVEAEIFMSVSMNYECYDTNVGGGKVTLTDSEFEVLVNTDKDSGRQRYNYIDYDMNGLSEWYTHNAFVEYSVGTVKLKNGTNTIILKTNNTTHTDVATMTATGPMVDYIRLETDATLSWTPMVENITNGTMVIGNTTLVG